MVRRHIFDIFEQEMNLCEEIERLEELLAQPAVTHNGIFDYTLEQFIDNYCLSEWKCRRTFTSFFDIRDKLLITEDQMRNPNNEQCLLYLEFLINMLELCERKIKKSQEFTTTSTYDYLMGNIDSVLENLNMKVFINKEEEQLWIVEKDAAVTAVAEIVDPSLGLKVIEYNHYLLKGDLKKKQSILKSFADKFEAIRPDLKEENNNLQSDIGFLLNNMNIRHNNLEGDKEVPYLHTLSANELESWYDEIYQLLLLAMLEYDNIPRKKKVKDLKRNIGG